MKALAVWPFCSQQDKQTGEFLLDSDVTCLLMKNVARCWDGEIVSIVPFETRGTMPGVLRCVDVPRDNAQRRRHFDRETTREALRGCDVVVLNNELIAPNVRTVFDGRIVHFNHLMPIGEHSWMQDRQLEAWRTADLVVFLTGGLREFARRMGCEKSTVWPMAVSDDVKTPIRPAMYDCVFPQRCSITNYTHHVEFLRAAELLPHLRFAVTDPTNFLTEWPSNVFRYTQLDRDAYLTVLASSKTVVGLMEDDLHGGVAVREAMASGCWPILLDRPCYTPFARTQIQWPVDYWKLAAAVEAAQSVAQKVQAPELFSECKDKIRCELASM